MPGTAQVAKWRGEAGEVLRCRTIQAHIVRLSRLAIGIPNPKLPNDSSAHCALESFGSFGFGIPDLLSKTPK